jgi:chitosanase
MRGGFLALLAPIAFLLLVMTANWVFAQPFVEDSSSAAAPWEVQSGWSPLQALRAQQMTTYFENSSVKFDYAYVENLHDGRGYTAGRVGFCTGTGDLIQVVELYCAKVSSSSLCPYLPRLREINAEFQVRRDPVGDVKGLRDFAKAWVLAASDAKFRQAQDDIVFKLYMGPALDHSSRLGLSLALGKAIMFDSIIQHGDETIGDSAGDSLSVLIRKSLLRASLPLKHTREEEVAWLEAFLNVRREDLLNPVNHETQEVWAESVTRVDKLREFLNDSRNWDLAEPLELAPGVWTD